MKTVIELLLYTGQPKKYLNGQTHVSFWNLLPVMCTNIRSDLKDR